jgi:hypothetical protein
MARAVEPLVRSTDAARRIASTGNIVLTLITRSNSSAVTSCTARKFRPGADLQVQAGASLGIS